MILKFVMLNSQLTACCRKGLLGFVLCLAHAAASAELPDRIHKELNKASIHPDAVSVMVSTADGMPLIQHNADAAMRSASLMKLITTYAALELLGPAWTWPTDVYALGEIRDGVLNGPLVLKGYGDPSLSIERLWLLTQQLKQRGLREIRGGLVIDLSHFSPAQEDAKEKLDEPWDIVPGAVMISLQAERLFFESYAGQVKVRGEPDLGWNFKVDMPIIDRPCHADVEDQWWPLMDWTTSPPTAHITGRFPSGCISRVLNIGITDPLYFTRTVFQRLWQEQGGIMEGPTSAGLAPVGLQPYARIESAPLSRAIMDMNKFSSNPMARLIFLSIGKSRSLEGKSTAESADLAIRSWLLEKQLDFPELIQETGSGLSKSEQLSVRHWIDLLRSASRSRYAAEFISSLPIVGVDGTMSKRLKGEAGMGWGHFKTGTLSDTKSLAGYLTTSRGRHLLIAVQINAPNIGRRADPMLEDIVRLLFEDSEQATLAN